MGGEHLILECLGPLTQTSWKQIWICYACPSRYELSELINYAAKFPGTNYSRLTASCQCVKSLWTRASRFNVQTKCPPTAFQEQPDSLHKFKQSKNLVHQTRALYDLQPMNCCLFLKYGYFIFLQIEQATLTNWTIFYINHAFASFLKSFCESLMFLE